jgi:hypothetical protein
VSDLRGQKPAVLFIAVLLGAWAAQLLRPETALHLPGMPWNWLVALPPLAGLALGLLRPESRLARSLGSGQLAIASLLAVAATCWPIAVFPVGVAAPAWLHGLGLGDPLASLPFAAALLAVVVNLAVSLGRRLRQGEDRLRFSILHAGLLIAVVGGAAGHCGLVRARFILEEGANPGDTAEAEDGSRIRLPAALVLDDFVLERFAPMLLLDESGRLTRGEVLLGPGAVDRLRGLTVSVRTYLPAAAVVAGRPVAFRDPGANSAAEVSVRDASGAEVAVGWLHPRGPLGAELAVVLPGGRTLHLEPPRPQRFLARVRADGREAEITVNRPLRLDGWAIYLLSYDEALGPASRTAVFEAVEDRALPAVYVGLALLVLGVLVHLWDPRPAGGRR